MKKQKTSKMTHKELFEELIYDENINENMLVANDYPVDKFGNDIITMGFEGVAPPRKKGVHAMLILSFNKRGRLVSMEMATREKGSRKWQIGTSEVFMDFTPRFGDDKMLAAIDRKKTGN